jgi:hypothetical protein
MRDMVNKRFDKQAGRFIMGDKVKDLFVGSSGQRNPFAWANSTSRSTAGFSRG